MKKDPVMDHFLRTTLRDGARAADAPGEHCLDAEQLAAWSHGGLSAAAADEVEQHISGCERCQAMAATFARIEPAIPASESLWQRWRIAWLLPATAAMAMLVWLAMPGTVRPAPPATVEMARVEPPPSVVRVTPEPEIAGAAPVTAAPATPTAGAASPRREQTAGGRRAEAKSANQAAPGAPIAPPAPPPPALTPPPPQPVSLPVGLGQAAIAPPATTTVLISPPAAPPPSLPASARSDLARDGLVPGVAVVVAEFAPPDPAVVAVAGAGAVAQQGQAGAGGGRAAGGRGGGGGGAGRGGGAQQADRALAAPAPRVKWRVLSTGVVQRSIDNGVSWTAVTLDPTAAPARITGGAAPSPSVCWLIGQAGVVLRSVDGGRFSRVASPETTDLQAIRATDALQATVTTSTGRVFITIDGGVTWRLQGFSPAPF
jgi:hypothetical protein